MSKAERGMRRMIRVRVVGLAGLVVAGLIAGVLAKIADESQVGWLADLGTYPAVWALVLALIAWAAPRPGVSALFGGAFFAAMVAGYYGWAGLVFGFPRGSELLFWLTMAVLAVPPMATGVWWAMRNVGVVPGLILAATAAIVLANGAALRAVRALAGHVPLELVRPVQVVAEIAVTILLIVVLPHDHRTRWWAIGAWLPLVWLTPRMLDSVLGRIGVG